MVWTKGQNGGFSRPKGSPNKVTQSVRDAYKNLVEKKAPQFNKWIDRIAEDNPAEAMKIMIMMSEYFIPKLARTEVKTDTKQLMIVLDIPFSKQLRDGHTKNTVIEGQINDSEGEIVPISEGSKIDSGRNIA